MRICQRLKDLRAENNLTQGKIAELLDINRSTYANFEVTTEPNLSMLIKLADIYHLSLDELVGRIFEKEKTESNAISVTKAPNPDIQKALDRLQEHQPYLSEIHICNARRQTVKRYEQQRIERYLVLLPFLEYKMGSTDVIKSADSMLLSIAFFVCRHSYRQLQKKKCNVNQDILKLSGELLSGCSNLASEIEKEYKRKPHFKNRLITEENMLDKSFMQSYFHIDIDSDNLIIP